MSNNHKKINNIELIILAAFSFTFSYIIGYLFDTWLYLYDVVKDLIKGKNIARRITELIFVIICALLLIMFLSN
jgi:hypothetical protein